MHARSKRRLVISGGVFGLAVVAGAWMVGQHASDPYLFLKGKPLVDVSVMGPGSWPASETRTYTWSQDRNEVVSLATSELPKFGLRLEPADKRSPFEALWMGEKVNGGLCGVSSDRVVLIARGKANHPLANNMTNNAPDWVTVRISSDLDESWLNVVRYTLFGLDH